MKDNTAPKRSSTDPASPAGPAPAAHANRRRSERRPYIVEAWLVSKADPDSRTEVKTVNLSRHGIAFDLDRKVTPGSFHLMEIGFGHQRLIAEVRIITCRGISEGIFEIGAEFC